MLAVLLMALFPILTSEGFPILTSEGFAIYVEGSSIGGATAQFLVPSDLRDAVQGNAVVLSEVDGSVVQTLSTPSEIPYAGSGAALADGTFAIAVEQVAAPHPILSLNLYRGSDFSLISSITSIATATWDASNPVTATADTFYAAVYQVTTTILYQISASGVVSGTHWTLPVTAATLLNGLGISPTGTIAYYSAANTNISRWDLVNDVALSDLVTGFFFEQIAVTSAGDILAIYTPDATTFSVQRYSPAGTLVMTYPLGTAGEFEVPELTYSYGEPDTFWVKRFPDATGHTAQFQQIGISDGAVLRQWTVTQLNGGGQVPSTCPNLLLAGFKTTTYPIRRLRRFALPYAQNLFQFLSRLELIMQAGNGLTTGQGSAPVVMARISRDGGQTWGNELQMGTGAIGEYSARAYLNRLGRGRNFVVELSSSDPVFVSWLAVTVDLEQGTS